MAKMHKVSPDWLLKSIFSFQDLGGDVILEQRENFEKDEAAWFEVGFLEISLKS